jgi:hypothetical protein
MGGLARRFVQRLRGPPHELMDRDSNYTIRKPFHSHFHFTLAGVTFRSLYLFVFSNCVYVYY